MIRGDVITFPHAKREDPLETETREMTNNDIGRGILPATRAAITTAIITGLFLDLQTKAKKMTPMVPYPRLLWRHPFPRVWRNLPI